MVVWRSRAPVVKAATPLLCVPLQQLEQKIVSSCSARLHISPQTVSVSAMHNLLVFFLFVQFTLFLVAPLCVKQCSYFHVLAPHHSATFPEKWTVESLEITRCSNSTTCLFIIHSLVTYFTTFMSSLLVLHTRAPSSGLLRARHTAPSSGLPRMPLSLNFFFLKKSCQPPPAFMIIFTKVSWPIENVVV